MLICNEDLEGAHLVAAYRFHVRSVDGERDRPRFARRGGRWRRNGFALRSGADVHGPLADRFYFRGIPEREEILQQRTSVTVRQQAPIVASVRSCSSVQRSGIISAAGVMVRGGGRHAASAGTKAGRMNLHDAKQ